MEFSSCFSSLKMECCSANVLDSFVLFAAFAAVFIITALRLFFLFLCLHRNFSNLEWQKHSNGKMKSLSLLACLFVFHSSWIIRNIKVDPTHVFCWSCHKSLKVSRALSDRMTYQTRIYWFCFFITIRTAKRLRSTWTAWIMNHILFTSPFLHIKLFFLSFVYRTSTSI